VLCGCARQSGGAADLRTTTGVCVTILPPSADDVLSPLRAQVDDLARALTNALPADEQGVALKQRIFILHRAVEQHAQLIETLQGEVRALVDGWKGRFGAGGGSSLTPLSSAAIPAPSAGSRPAPAAAVPRTAAPTREAATPPLAPAGRSEDAAVQVARPNSGAAQGQPRVIDELNASTFVERGWSRIATGDFVGAEEALDKALTLNPGDAHAETLLGWAQMSQGKFDSAMALFEHVLDRVPDHALAHINVGYVLMRRKHFESALEHLTRAIALDSDRKATLYAHYYLGLVHFEERRYAESIGALLRAIELGPNLIEARFELGRVLWFADRTDDAIAAWRKGADLNKFNPWSARCRDMLATIADGGAPSRVA
jgi:tetratricopeptide (TPR) repeat protein